MLLKLLVYLLIGCVSIYGAAMIHVLQAKRDGYKVLEWWEKNYSLKPKDILAGTRDKLEFIIGLFLWPICLTRFIIMIPNLYEQYELSTDEEE